MRHVPVNVIAVCDLMILMSKNGLLQKGVCKKTTGSTGGRWVGQWWVGPTGVIAGVSLSRPLQTTGQHNGVQLFNSQLFDANLNSTQLRHNRPIQIKQRAK